MTTPYDGIPAPQINPALQQTIKEMVAIETEEISNRHAEEMARLTAQLEAANARAEASAAAPPANLIPEHAAGKGTEVAETWSQAQQEAARG